MDGPGAGYTILVDALIGGRRDLAARISTAIRTTLPPYRSLPDKILDGAVEFTVQRLLQCVQSGRATLDSDELAELVAAGAARAHHGIPVDDLLRAWRSGLNTLIGCAREAAGELGVDDAAVLHFAESTLKLSDGAMIAAVEGHRGADHVLQSTADDHRARFVRETLLGAVPFTELRVRAEMYGLDPTVEYVAVRAQIAADGGQCQLEAAVFFPAAPQNRNGLSAVIDGDLAGFFVEAPPGNIDGVIGVGPPRPLERLADSYRLAVRALTTARACNLRGIYDMPSLGVRSAVVMDTDVGEVLRQRYLQPLTAGGFADDLVATLRAYLACGMRVESTAARLFVHHNTVRYRLARFEELTGVSLRETEILVELWWALELSTMHQ